MTSPPVDVTDTRAVVPVWADVSLPPDCPAAVGTDGDGSAMVRLGQGLSGVALIGGIEAMTTLWRSAKVAVDALTEEAAT